MITETDEMKCFNVVTKDGYVIAGMKSGSLISVINGLNKMIESGVLDKDKINGLDEITIKEIGEDAFEFRQEMVKQNGGIIGKVVKKK